MTPEASLPIQNVIGFPVAALPFDRQMELILKWAGDRRSKVVCVANVHMLVEGYYNANFGSVLRDADLVTPDGMPLVWMMNALGNCHQDRVAGMDILLSLCERSPELNISVFFLGSEQKILDLMRRKLKREFPQLAIAGMEPLPFRPMTSEEDEAVIRRINESGAGIVFVALGCPKQELWMHQHKHRIQAVMIGLGGAFPVYAGVHKWAPTWVRKSGFEWAYRLIQEPRRLWRRYYETIPPFVYLACKQILRTHLYISRQQPENSSLS